MAGIHSRLRVLEERLSMRDQQVPVFIIALDDEDSTGPWSAEYDGEIWEQGASEDFEDFKDRATAGAVLHPPTAGRFPTIFLCLQQQRSSESQQSDDGS